MESLGDKIEHFFSNNKIAVYVFAALSFILFTWLFFSVRWDDSYIAFRYGLNFVHNGHWNWNSDSNNVEAYTNFSYAFLTIIPIFLHVDPTVFFTIVNIVWMGVILYRVKAGTTSFVLFCCALLLTVFNPFFNYHIATGMETIFFAFLLFEAFRCLLQPLNGGSGEVYFYFILLLLPLTRPEGAIYAVVCFFVNMLVNKRKVEAKVALGLVILIGIGYMGWRVSHFQKLLPNTFYLKSVKGFSLKNWVRFVINARLYLIMLFVLNLLIRNKVVLIVSILTAVIAMFLYAPSDLVTTTFDRFPLQVFLPVFLASLFVVTKKQAVVLLPVSLLWFYLGSYTAYNDYHKASPFSPAIYFYKEVGKSLSKYSNKNYTLIIGEAGIIPYYSNWKAYDFIGLADRELSTKKISPGYLEPKSPDVVFLYSTTMSEADIPPAFYDQGVIYDYIKRKGIYSKVGSLNVGWGGLLIYVKTTIPDYPAMKTELGNIAAQSQILVPKADGAVNMKNWLTLKYIQ